VQPSPHCQLTAILRNHRVADRIDLERLSKDEFPSPYLFSALSGYVHTSIPGPELVRMQIGDLTELKGSVFRPAAKARSREKALPSRRPRAI
jgi:hypothetical protein